MRTTHPLLLCLLVGCGADGDGGDTDSDAIGIPEDDVVRGSCPAALTCAAVAAPSEFNDLRAAYGSGGSCFSGDVDPSVCRAACKDLLTLFAFQVLENEACPSFAWTEAGSSWGTMEAEVTGAWRCGDLRVGDKARLVIDRVVPSAPRATVQVPIYLPRDGWFERSGGVDVDCEVTREGACQGSGEYTDFGATWKATVELADVDGRLVDATVTQSIRDGRSNCEYTARGTLAPIPAERDGEYWEP